MSSSGDDRRRLDDDDEHWALANRGRVYKSRPHLRTNRNRDVDREALHKHYMDLIAVYRRAGSSPPASLVPPGYSDDDQHGGYDEDPNFEGDWRDDWSQRGFMLPEREY